MRTALVVLAVACACLPAAGQADKKKEVQVDNRTKKVVAPFLGGLRTKDVEVMLKVADVPWYHNGKKVIRNRDDLKKELQEVVKRDFNMAGFYYKALNRFADVMGELTDEQRALAKGVVDPEDTVVTIQVYLPKNVEQIIHLVLRRNGELKVIGVID